MGFPIKIPAPYVMPWMIRALRHRLPQPLWEIPNSSNQVALTFDDGPGCFTPGLLDVLKKEGIRATFFTVGTRIERYPDILRRIYSEGHLIALHTYRHRNIKKNSEAGLREDLARCKDLVLRTLDLQEDPVWYFRPPHGSCNPETLRILDSEKIRTVMFSIVPGEQIMPRGWRELPERTCRRVLREVKSGSIIALHDGEYIEDSDNIFNCPHIAETAEMLIRKLKALGYGFTRVGAF
jgi:peptidoglycan/xylan/chitin deacetylase (PgdA/CDA1 family)